MRTHIQSCECECMSACLFRSCRRTFETVVRKAIKANNNNTKMDLRNNIEEAQNGHLLRKT